MLSKETIERIEQDAVIKYYKGNRSLTATFLQEGYISGATAEATRYEDETKELVEVIKELLEGIDGLPPLTAIAGVLEKQYSKAKATLLKNK